jgi:diguanylate cyclase (GGDEF)-like protein
VSRSTRHGEPLSLALIDLDDFQLVNNLHGHSHGDRILAALAQCLESHRLEDRRFRLGGDEFALSLPAVSLPDALIILERLRARAESLLFGATLSIGVATMDLDDSAMDAETLREQADAALYEAKRRGRNTVVSFDEIKASSAIVSSAHINAVRRLLAERRISIAFQPIWDIERKKLLGCEGLMRPPTGCDLSGPQDAFDIVEKLGRARSSTSCIATQSWHGRPTCRRIASSSSTSLLLPSTMGASAVKPSLRRRVWPASSPVAWSSRSLSVPWPVPRLSSVRRSVFAPSASNLLSTTSAPATLVWRYCDRCPSTS